MPRKNQPERVFPKFVLLHDPTDAWPVGHVHDLLRLRRDIQAARNMREASWWADGCKFCEFGKASAPVLTLRGSALVDDAGRVVYQIDDVRKRNHCPAREQRQARAAELFAGGAGYNQIAAVLGCTVPAAGNLLAKWRAKHGGENARAIAPVAK